LNLWRCVLTISISACHFGGWWHVVCVRSLALFLPIPSNHCSDPLFQQTLISVVRDSTGIFSPSPLTNFSTSDPNTWTGLPIVFDEVFTGLYRLGRFTPSSFLQSLPDISVHAKLLTGGLVPLCTTLASDSIYKAFLGSEKRDALLHGHSYTAHPVGCHVANTSLKALIQLDESEEWKGYKSDWQEVNESLNQNVEIPREHAWSVWSRGFVTQISHSRQIESVNALGSVLVINLQDDNAGTS
jgi:dethiobiotin synthetase/adenosylmethionine--8-amino-7-oxononanoate aminotransferase